MSDIRNQLVDIYGEEEMLFADGLDDAIIGVCDRSLRVIYSKRKCLIILQAEGMSEEEAHEHFSFNINSAWVGDRTPIWCDDLWTDNVDLSNIL